MQIALLRSYKCFNYTRKSSKSSQSGFPAVEITSIRTSRRGLLRIPNPSPKRENWLANSRRNFVCATYSAPVGMSAGSRAVASNTPLFGTNTPSLRSLAGEGSVVLALAGSAAAAEAIHQSSGMCQSGMNSVPTLVSDHAICKV